MRKLKRSLTAAIEELLEKSKGKSQTIESIIHLLSGRGQAVLLVLISLPFCLPVQIPGFSTPFGLVCAFIGLRIAFGHRVWLPQMLLKKEIPYTTLKRMANFTTKMSYKIRYLVHPRLEWMLNTSFLHYFHGMVIFVLGILLSLPLPIPFTNLLSAFPLLFFGLGILEDDGLMILLAYFSSLVCFAAFAGMYWFGEESLKWLFT